MLSSLLSRMAILRLLMSWWCTVVSLSWSIDVNTRSSHKCIVRRLPCCLRGGVSWISVTRPLLTEDHLSRVIAVRWRVSVAIGALAWMLLVALSRVPLLPRRRRRVASVVVHLLLWWGLRMWRRRCAPTPCAGRRHVVGWLLGSPANRRAGVRGVLVGRLNRMSVQTSYWGRADEALSSGVGMAGRSYLLLRGHWRCTSRRHAPWRLLLLRAQPLRHLIVVDATGRIQGNSNGVGAWSAYGNGCRRRHEATAHVGPVLLGLLLLLRMLRLLVLGL